MTRHHHGWRPGGSLLAGCLCAWMAIGVTPAAEPGTVLLVVEKEGPQLRTFWQQASATDIPIQLVDRPQTLDETTDLAPFAVVIVDTTSLREGFARQLERWVYRGGIAIVARIPTHYAMPPGVAEPPWAIYRHVNAAKEGSKQRNCLLRLVPAATLTAGRLTAFTGPTGSLVHTGVHTVPLATAADDERVSGLELVTGWPRREFGSLALLTGTTVAADGSITPVTLAIRTKYGRGAAYYTSLPLHQDKPLGAALRAGIWAQLGADRQSSPTEPVEVYARPQETAAAPSTAIAESLPKRPAPPANCLLEIQGDEFSGAIGSPTWAPWRIALTSSPLAPMCRTISLPPGQALWMEVKAAYGDHHSAPQVRIAWNETMLFDGTCPWDPIQYNPAHYEQMRPVRFYLPAESVQASNVLTFLDDGPEWLVLDWVRFYRADSPGTESLAQAIAADRPDRHELFALSGAIELDGRLTEKTWSQAAWQPLGNESGSHDSPFANDRAEFAVAVDAQTLYIGLRGPRQGAVTEILLAPPGCHQAYLFCVAATGEVGVRNLDGEIIPQAAIRIAATDEAAEIAIPLSLVPGYRSHPVFRPQQRVVLPYAICEFNLVDRRSRQNAAIWRSYLPFRGEAGETKELFRLYQTLVSYHAVYASTVKGLLYCPEDRAATIAWPAAFQLGLNSLRVNNRDGAWTRAVVVIRPAGGSLSRTACDLQRGLAEVPFVLGIPGRQEITVELYDAQGTLSGLEMRPATVEMPFACRWDHSFYTTERIGELVLTALTPDHLRDLDGRVAMTVWPTGGPAERVEKALAAMDNHGTLRFPVELSKLAAGRYQPQLSLQLGGQVSNCPVPVLEKLSPAPSEGKIRNDGYLLVDGKPFFPLGLLMVYQMDNLFPDWRFVKEGGMNTVVLWRDASRKELDEAAAAGLHVVISPTGRPNGAGKWQPLFAPTEAIVTSVRDCPALLGYYLIDEPEYWHTPLCVPQQLKEFDAFLHRLDPRHPTMISHAVGGIHYGTAEGMTFNDAVDIVIDEQYGDPISLVHRMAEYQKLGHGDRAVPWAFLRLGADSSHPHACPGDLRASAYTAFICGYRGIFFFNSMTARCLGHEVWPHLSAAVANEVQQLAASRLQPTSVPLTPPATPPEVPVMLWRDGDTFWLAAANVGKEPRELSLKLTRSGTAQSSSCPPLFPAMPAALVESGRFRATLPPNGVGAWRIPAAVPAKP